MLEKICIHCSKVFDDVSKPCLYCNYQAFKKYKFTGQFGTYKMSPKSDSRMGLTPEEIYNLFSKLSDEDLKKIGYITGNPKDMIMGYIPVVPPVARPAEDTGIDRVTKIYKTILEKLRARDDFCDSQKVYQIHVIYERLLGLGNLYDSSTKMLKQKLSGKQGIFRRDILGKRVKPCEICYIS